ncbi:hypothetical protein NKDENANG_04006 [Candidatus Entotheonellaceae bacterium PAL068K]
MRCSCFSPELCGSAWLSLELVLLLLIVMSCGVLRAQTPPTETPSTSVLEEGLIRLAAQRVRAGAAGQLTVDLKLPDGYYLHPRAPLSYRINLNGSGIDVAEPHRRYTGSAPSLPFVIPFQAAAGTHQTTVDMDLTFYYCPMDNTGVCVIQSVRWIVPLHTTPDHSVGDPVIAYTVEAPDIDKQL